MRNKVTAQDIADALGVSNCTVSNALSGKPNVSEARRRQIQEKAREMGFEIDSVAQAMARNPINVGVVSSVAPDDQYYLLLKKGILYFYVYLFLFHYYNLF